MSIFKNIYRKASAEKELADLLGFANWILENKDVTFFETPRAISNNRHFLFTKENTILDAFSIAQRFIRERKGGGFT